MPPDLRVRAALDYAFLDAALAALANPERLRILGYLTRPRSADDVARQMGVSRQAAAKHLAKLAEAGLVERREGTRGAAAVTTHVLDPRALFLVHDEFEKMGSLRRRGQREAPGRTLVVPVAPPPGPPLAGPCFHVVRGMDTGHRFALPHTEQRTWTLGRAGSCDVSVAHDPYASKRHAEVRWTGAGFALADLGSTNRTFHNFAALPKHGLAPLRHGDVVGVGKTLLLFWLPG